MLSTVNPYKVERLTVEHVEHATFGGSSAYVWMNCTGWADLMAAVPYDKSEGMQEAADEGSALHLVMEELIAPRVPDYARFAGPTQVRQQIGKSFDWRRLTVDSFDGCIISFRGSTSARDVVVTPERLQLVQFAFDAVEFMLRNPTAVYVERKVFLSRDELFMRNAYGYCDLGILHKLDSGNYRLTIVDYKFGWVRVNVEGEQLQYYAAGLLLEILRLNPDIVVEFVECIILQPKLDGFTSICYSAMELKDFANKAQAAIFTALGGAGKLNAGNHCKYCHAAKICPELRDQLLSFQNAPRTPANLWGPDEWETWVKRANVVRIAASRIEAAAYDYILAGGRIPGYKVVKAKDNLTWEDKHSARRILLKRGIDEATLAKDAIVTPLELLKRNPTLDLTGLVKRITQNMLVPENDRREAVKPEASVDAFGDWPELPASESGWPET